MHADLTMLPRDVLLHLACFLDAFDIQSLITSCSSNNKSNKRNTIHHVLQDEVSTKSLLGIRLAYLNARQQKHTQETTTTTTNMEHRFGRLVSVPEVQVSHVDAFLQQPNVTQACQRIVLKHMFAYNNNQKKKNDGNNIIIDRPRFVLAGGSMLCLYRQFLAAHSSSRIDDQKEKRSSSSSNQGEEEFSFGDLDVFVMEANGDATSSDEALRQVLCAASREIDQAAVNAKKIAPTQSSSAKDRYHQPSTTTQGTDNNDSYDYAVVRTSGTLTMVVSNASRPLQVILRRITSIEELLCFFDMDCCRFAFDGQTFWTTKEGLRAVTLGRNFVEREHADNPMYTRRAIKYASRGFTTKFGVLHPLQHLLEAHESAFDRQQEKDAVMGEAITSDYADYVDEGLYFTLANASLSELYDILAWEPKLEPNSDDDSEESFGYDDGEVDEDNREYHLDGSLLVRCRENTSALQEMLKAGGFAPSFSTHFDILQGSIFLHFYYERHLRHKYNIARCYITGKWFHCPATGDAHFSPLGHEINQIGYSVDRDLTGKVAVVTGARVRIGFATCLELLQRGATVIATTRFAADAKERFQKEEDYKSFQQRLHILPLNLLCSDDIEHVVAYIKSSFRRVDILINNAAQTVRLPLRCYTQLIQKEYGALYRALRIKPNQKLARTGKSNTNEKTQCPVEHDEVLAGSQAAETNNASLSTSARRVLKVDIPTSLAYMYAPPNTLLAAIETQKSETLPVLEELRLASIRCMFRNLHPDDRLEFPDGKVPKNAMSLLRQKQEKNSWKMDPTEVHPIEMFETQTINHLSPTLLLNQLFPLLQTTPESRDPGYVVNVTSIEGQFNVDGTVMKESNHLHTNMSKAALNMLTRSGSSFYAKKGVLVNSVDTGWVSSGMETWKPPPLTARDAALRVLHPMLRESKEFGKLYKNYQQTAW